jgi:Type I phosphodiesterase / nucleotide pyrophosphatase
MSPRVVALVALLATATAAHAQSPLPLDAFARGVEGRAAGIREGAPRLMVAFLFDQWRGDLLDRYRPAFGKDGFVRVMNDGARFTDCTIPYAITYTGPGHATWLSGAPPSVHGIVGNDWYDRVLGRHVTCVEDPRFKDIGVAPGLIGEAASPRFMRAETIADVLKKTTFGRGRVVALSDKARGAVLPAGRHPDGAYWMDGSTGLYQTSSYYASAPPSWLVEANERRAQRLIAMRGSPWLPRASLPASVWSGTTPDPDDTFPHPLVMPRNAPGNDGSEPRVRAPAVGLTQHPIALEGVFDLASAALDGERLGEDDVPDLLIVSVSVTDRVGHLFGPDSPEALDLASRADSALADFLDALDTKIGRGR